MKTTVNRKSAPVTENKSPREFENRALEMVQTAALIPYAGNARTHSPAQVAQIVAAVREFGWTNPLLIDEAGRIIAGHGRLQAAVYLEMPAVPCIRLSGLTDTQKRALTIADNRIAETSGWDLGTLSAEMDALTVDGFDVALTGFEAEDLAALLGSHGELLDPLDGARRTGQTPQQSIRWTTHTIPLEADEIEKLNDALTAYTKREGGAFGFVRSLFGSV